MYSVSTSFIAAAEANARQIMASANFNGSTNLDGENIIEMAMTEAVGPSSGLTMGATISSQLSMTLKMPESPLLLEGGYVLPAAGFYGTEKCPLGKFYIAEATSKDDFSGIFKIVAYDGFSKTENKYNPSITMPNTAANIMADIATQCGIELSTTIEYPAGEFGLYDYTCRQYIGYFAGLMGKNARFSRDGLLTFTWYANTSYAVGRDQQYMGGFRRLTESDFIANSLTSGASGNTLVAGTGTGINFENPFMTQEILNGILSAIGSPSYTPASLKWRGNPAIEAGDIIMVEDKSGVLRTLYVMQQTLRISGGFHSEIKCYGESEAAMSFSTSPQDKKIQQIYTSLQKAVAEATKLLNGANGGIFEVTDENGDGINDGWKIHSADDSQFIKATLNGIGITTDGGTTYTQAITPAGVNASAVTTGQMSAQRITVGDSTLGDVFEVTTDEDNHPVVIIGSSASDIRQKQTNDAINFVDDNDQTVAKFSITGAEWTDMQQIKYCGFVWAKSNVTGNVRFTKVKEE